MTIQQHNMMFSYIENKKIVFDKSLRVQALRLRIQLIFALWEWISNRVLPTPGQN